MDVSIDRNPEVPLTLAVPQPDAKTSKPGNDVKLTIEKPPAPKPKPRPANPTPPPVRPPPPPPPPVQPSAGKDYREAFEEFANPRKLKPMPQQADIEMDLDDLSDVGSDLSAPDNGSDAPSDDMPSDYSVDEPGDPDDENDPLRPSPGFASVDEEKASLIFKLARAKRAGMPSTRNFTMASDVREMRSEMARIEHELALDASLKFQRKMLMMTVSAMEYMNHRFDPFELQLDGWSESVHSSISDYDRVFERLHEKYKSKVQMAPEIELLFMLAGSAMMFHFTKTVFKQGLPGIGANPELMASMMKAFTQAKAPQAQPPPPPPPSQAPASSQPAVQSQGQGQQQSQRREMRGPAMDLGGILGGLTGGGAMPFPPMPPPQIANPVDKSKKTVSFAPGTKRPAPGEEEEERLSDVVSDPSELESIPDDLSSFGSELTDDGDIKTIQVANKKGRGNKKAKTVITL